MRDVVEIFTFLAYAVPTIMFLSGIFLLVIGYPIDHADIITAGGVFIFLGGGIFILEFLILLIRYYSRNESNEEAQSYVFLTPRYVEGKSYSNYGYYHGQSCNHR